jgi:hypothetical protein
MIEIFRRCNNPNCKSNRHIGIQFDDEKKLYCGMYLQSEPYIRIGDSIGVEEIKYKTQWFLTFNEAKEKIESLYPDFEKIDFTEFEMMTRNVPYLREYVLIYGK